MIGVAILKVYSVLVYPPTVLFWIYVVAAEPVVIKIVVPGLGKVKGQKPTWDNAS